MKRNIYFLIITLLLTVSSVSAKDFDGTTPGQEVADLIAFAELTGGGDNEIKLTGDITINNTTLAYGLMIGRTLTLDLNGHSLTINMDGVINSNGIKIGSGVTLTDRKSTRLNSSH